MSALTGAPTLLRASIKQDRLNIAPWVMLISVLSATSIIAYRWVIDTPQERTEIATSLGLNPALGLVFGQARDLMTPEGFNAWRALMLGCLFAGLMTIMVVVRNSRAQEDSGQAELLASGVLGRQSRLAVAIAMAVVASLALGVVSWLLTVAFGATMAATAVQSACYAASGLMFAAVAAITCQVGAESRTATTLAVAIVGVLYAARGYLTTSDLPDWTTWLTPFGWLSETRPASGDRWWPLIFPVLFALVCIAIAFALEGRRDFGQGYVATRPGPAHGGDRFGIGSLTWNLHTPSVTGWMVGFAALGLMFGSLVSTMAELVVNNPALAQVLASGAVSPDELRSTFVATILQIIAIVVAIMGAGIMQRIRTEEIDFRVEPLLAGALRRPRYLGVNLLLALLTTAVGMMLAGVALGWVASRAEESIVFTDVVRQAAVTIPAVWVLVGLNHAVVGAKPSKRVVGWLAIVATFAITLLGPTLHLWDWAMAISPLHHVPNVAAHSPEWSGLGWLALALGVFTVIGFAGFRRRDIA